ncbi:FAD:protein FMN transferase [Kineococcus sp. NBC_00420]|uniref:FAD:protein FMN transferase n=1 Tax=Kineococcus sp. NBC_00420 TaxID=2903564 RepID=UPI002E234DF2
MSGEHDAATVRRVEQVMGFPVSLAIRGRHREDAAGRDAWDAVLASLRAAEAVFSHYRPQSWASRLGRGEVTVADCPPEVAEVLAIAEEARRDSRGAFDVHRPGADGVRRLDTAGVVKGWALERAAVWLTGLPDTDSCLSGGGDVLCHNASPGSPPWHIGIEDPADPRRIIATVAIANGAIATSGTAHRGAHLVDARTGVAPTAVAQVSVIAPSLTRADVDATAAYALGPDAARWLGGRPGTSGLVVWADGTTEVVADP